MAVAVIAFVVPVAISVAMIVVIFVLTVVIAVVVAELLAVFVTTELPFPAAMTAPVGMLATHRVWAMIAESRIKGAVDVAAEANGAMKPWAGTEENAASEPGRTVVAERSAVIRRVVVVAVWADWFCADVHRDLYLGPEGGG